MKVLKCTSFKLSEARLANLKMIAKANDCFYNEQPSVGELLNRIADGKLELVSAQKKIDVFQKTALDSRQLSWVEPKSPGCEEVVFPPKNPYVRQVEFSENVVDTSEFDTPVPQRRPIVSIPADKPSVAIPIITNLNPEQKRSAFDQLKGILQAGRDSSHSA